MKITAELIEQGKSQRGGWSKQQIKLLGLTYPLEKGWRQRILGQWISEENARLFVELKDQHLKNKSQLPSLKSVVNPPKNLELFSEINSDLNDPQLSEVTIYTDGACIGNPGVGGWAALLMYGSHSKEIFGSEPLETTSNRMEMKAAIEGLRALKRPCNIKLYSDSQLLINTMNYNWKKKKNQDLWQELSAVSRLHQIEWIWVKGHADNVFNNRVDQLASQAAKSVKV